MARRPDWMRGGREAVRARADRARDARDWGRAADLYRDYLEQRPQEAAIWIQLGNCAKEAGRFDDSIEAYLKAETLRPRDADLQLQLGHLNKVRGDLPAALQRYRRAAALDPAHADAVREADQLVDFIAAEPLQFNWSHPAEDWSEAPLTGPGNGASADPGPGSSAEGCIERLAVEPADAGAWGELERMLAEGASDPGLQHVIARIPADADLLLSLARLLLRQGYPLAGRDALRRAFRRAQRLDVAEELRRLGAPFAYLDQFRRFERRGPARFLDVTDLFDVLRGRATVTGIQRVQCSLISEATRLDATSAVPEFEFCIGHERRLWRVGREDLQALLAHIHTYGASDLDGRRRLIDAARGGAVRIEPQAGDAVVVTGAPYLTPEIAACAQSLKKAGAKLGAVIHDFIPLTHPEFALASYTHAFSAAMSDLVVQLDFALPNSVFTGQETRRLMQEGGYPPIPMQAVPLAHSMRGDRASAPSHASGWKGAIANLRNERFVLCVGTFAAHKNQELLFNVWRELIARGVEPPTLLLVGHKSHGVDDLFRQLEATHRLDGRIRLLEGVEDDQIETLYGACLFTVFPSKIEGWGLPVGESLAHGKLCVASNAASIPEVGGDLAVYIDPYDVQGAADVIAELLGDPEHLAFLERRLKAHFKPRTWTDYAGELGAAIDDLVTLADEAAHAQPAVLTLPPNCVLKACAPAASWEHGVALPERDEQAAIVLRKLVLAEGWGGPESWGVWMDGPKALLRLPLSAAPGSRVVVALQLRAALWAVGNQIQVRAGCGAATVASLPPSLSTERERSIPRNMVVTLDCTVGATGDVELTIEVLGEPAPSWWGETRTLVIGLVRLTYLPVDHPLIGLQPCQVARPSDVHAGPASRLIAMSADSLALQMRGRLALASGWRQDDAGRAWMTGQSASVAFQAKAAPGEAVRVVVSVWRDAAKSQVGIDLSCGPDARNRFEVHAGQDRAQLWLDCTVPADGRIVVELQLAGGTADLADLSLGLEGVLFGLMDSADNRQRLLEALQLPMPASSGDELRRAHRRGMRFVVAGHMQGSYSLAQMNRRMALAFERLSPGGVAIEQVEGHRTLDLADTPIAERRGLMQLARRSSFDDGPVVSISQHWPIWSRPAESDLALAFFHWEEGLAPQAIVTQLNRDFDGVLAPTRSVAKALVDSGVFRPVVVVGDGPEVDRLLAAERRRSIPSVARPFTFLHVSSCFPRKGVDVLLKAYVGAFTADDPVRLVIKGVPNPHNDVADQIGRLRSEHPAAPPIEFINDDLAREDVEALMLKADALVLPSRGEGYNLPALEGLAAGLPVIATGFGGQMDFLTADVARLVDYSFDASQSHVTSPGSTWGEPDPLDLSEAMREALEAAASRAAEQRAAKGREVARRVGDDLAWVERIRDAALDILRAPAPITPKIAWVSTWRVSCGIAQYSSMLLEPYPHAAEKVVVLCDGRTAPEDLARRGGPQARVAWDIYRSASVETLAREIGLSGADVVVIQHQSGLIRWADLARLLRHPQLARRQVIVELHTTHELPAEGTPEGMDAAAALRAAARVLVHTVRDLNAVKAYGLADNATLFPHGVAPSTGPRPKVRTLGPGAAPLIGCYGFFLPRKGIDELIRAFAIVRRRWPKARLRLVNAEFPDVASKNEIALCQSLARRLGVFDAIEWRTEFLENEDSQRLLAECDLVVLAHQQTKESASGAVRIAIASGAPVAVTPIAIFEDVQAAVARFDDLGAEAIARGAADLLADRAERQSLQARASEWAQAYAWPVLAERLAGMAAGLVATARVPGGAERLPDMAGPLRPTDVPLAANSTDSPAPAACEIDNVPGEALRA